MLNKRLWLITEVAQANVARRYKLRNCKGVVICGSFSQRYVFGETILHSGKKSHKQRVHENYNQKLLSRYKMNLCDVALSVEHTASPGMCALEEDGMQAVLVLHREKFVQTKRCMEITVNSFNVGTQ